MTDGSNPLRIYNTLTRTKEDFVPIDPDHVRMYVCGPTVYDYAHIGNARPAIVFDVLYRLLRHLYGEDRVTYVRNITDVDDKINARALRDYGAEIEAGRLSLNEAIRKVTEPTYDQYQKDVTALGCLPPTHQPRATEYVLPRADGRADMVSLIQSLIDRGHAYAAKGEILFDTASMPDYGQLSKRNLDEQQAGARIAVDAHKKNPGDFVLWKESSDAEPGWDATFTVDGVTRTVDFRLSIVPGPFGEDAVLRILDSAKPMIGLEKLGLVKRSRDPSDLRAVLVEVTPEGLLRHREALAVRRANLESMLGKLTDEERDTLARALAPLERLATQSENQD